MATSSSARISASATGEIGALLWSGRPLLALAVVWLTIAGHTMNLRELGVARGWVPAELFSLQSAFLFALTLMLLPCPRLAHLFSARRLALSGLLILAAGSFLNGLLMHAPMMVFWLGRALAGAGAALVLYFAPRLLEMRWQRPASWAGIFLPVAGPAVIAAASMIAEVSDWQWGYFSEGAAALLALALLGPRTETPQNTLPPRGGSLAYLPFLVVGVVALGYVLHWGQLNGWLEDARIFTASALGVAAFAAAAWLVWPQLDLATLAENWIRLLLYFFGGLNQFFHGYTMNVYGGTLVNFSTWQRSWLIWAMPLGVAVSLFVIQMLRLRRGRTRGLLSAVSGLLLLAAGLYLNYRQTLEWPFWQLFDTLDLNWFPAPQHWELAPGRFLMGAGIGLFMAAIGARSSPDLVREEKIHPFLLMSQTFGGAVGAGVLVNFLLIGHLVQYSYSADRGYIQASELADRQTRLREELARIGAPAPEHTAEALLYRAIRYEADNMVFAFIYAAFLAASLVLAGVCLVLWAWYRFSTWASETASAPCGHLSGP
jgi:MFS family permease